MKLTVFAAGVIGAVGFGFLLTTYAGLNAQPASNPPAVIPLKDTFDVPEIDAQGAAIVTAAQDFLSSLTAEQRAASVFALSDDTQRSNWSNFPDAMVQRRGVQRGDLTDDQLAKLDALLATVMSADGVRNTRLQLAAEDSLSGDMFSSDYYYVAFLGEPATDQPWMMQFGGHHLAYNITVFGPETSFSPMLTGGQPLEITFEGENVTIAEEETTAAQTLLESLSDAQKAQAVRSDRAIQLVLGPGEFGTVVAPEGIRGSDLDDRQKGLLLDVVHARMSFMNDDDYAAKMAEVEAGLDDTYFGWWGPQDQLGAAYFRVTAPTLVMEYSPQELGGDVTDHAHNMYRDPTNDYGMRWISAE